MRFNNIVYALIFLMIIATSFTWGEESVLFDTNLHSEILRDNSHADSTFESELFRITDDIFDVIFVSENSGLNMSSLFIDPVCDIGFGTDAFVMLGFTLGPRFGDMSGGIEIGLGMKWILLSTTGEFHEFIILALNLVDRSSSRNTFYLEGVGIEIGVGFDGGFKIGANYQYNIVLMGILKLGAGLFTDFIYIEDNAHFMVGIRIVFLGINIDM